jgi:hypothetical protein
VKQINSLQQILEQIRNPTKWELMDYATDMDWVHHTAPLVMMGDAVHGMVRRVEMKPVMGK